MNRFTAITGCRAFSALALIALFSFSSCNSRHFWKGLRAYEKKQYSEAIANFEQAWFQWPNDTMALRLMGQSQLIVGDYANAARSFEELDLRAGLNAEDRQSWATALMNDSKYLEASDVLQPLMTPQNTNEYHQTTLGQLRASTRSNRRRAILGSTNTALSTTRNGLITTDQREQTLFFK